MNNFKTPLWKNQKNQEEMNEAFKLMGLPERKPTTPVEDIRTFIKTKKRMTESIKKPKAPINPKPQTDIERLREEEAYDDYRYDKMMESSNRSTRDPYNPYEDVIKW